MFRPWVTASGTMLAAPFDPVDLKVTGPSATVLTDVTTYDAAGAAQVAVSDTGVLLTIGIGGGATTHRTAVTIVDRTGRSTPVPFPPASYQAVSLSPEARSVALSIDNANASISGELARATATRLWSNDHAVWSPDGSRVTFTSGRGGARNVFVQSTSANSEPDQLTNSDHNQLATSWSSDARYILFDD